MNKTKRTIMIAHPLKVCRTFVSNAFAETKAGGMDARADVHGAYREAATAAQAARLSQALGYGWSSNLRNPASRPRIAA